MHNKLKCQWCSSERFTVEEQAFQKLGFDANGEPDWGEIEAGDRIDRVFCRDCGHEVPEKTWVLVLEPQGETNKRLRLNKEEAYNLLKEQIEEHNKEKCKCDLAEGGYGLCYAGQWLGGIISSSQVIRDSEE